MKFADLVLTARQSRRSWRIISHWEIYEKRLNLPKFYIFCHRFQLFFEKKMFPVFWMQTVGGNILHSTQDCRISLNSRRKPNILLFTGNSTTKPNYLLEYMGSSHINQSYFTWHTLTNELKSTLVSELKVALPSLWQSTKCDNGKSRDKASRKEEYIPTMANHE